MEYCLLLVALLFIIFFPMLERRRQAVIYANRKRARTRKENTAMEMLAKQFIGKECLVYTVTDTMGSIQGTVKEVTGGGLILECSDGLQAVNLEYVTPHPGISPKRKGKEKSFFCMTPHF